VRRAGGVARSAGTEAQRAIIADSVRTQKADPLTKPGADVAGGEIAKCAGQSHRCAVIEPDRSIEGDSPDCPVSARPHVP
jgi:hypothetical protein